MGLRVNDATLKGLDRGKRSPALGFWHAWVVANKFYQAASNKIGEMVSGFPKKQVRIEQENCSRGNLRAKSMNLI
jgi:hypothetical protein